MRLSHITVLSVIVASGAFAAEPAKAPPLPPAQAQVPAAPTLGRMFFTPEERATIDELRRRPAVVAAAVERKPLPPAPDYVTLNGVVRRSDGSTAVWLNNRMIDGRRTADGLEVTDSKRSPGGGNVTVKVPQAGRSVDLRVGQRLDTTSGKVQERYQVAPNAAVESESPAAESVSTAPRSESIRRPSRDRDRERDRRDIEGSRYERPEPAAEPKG